MKIIWFTWKDITHPRSGGAEFLGDRIATKLVEEGHEIIFITSNYKGAKKTEIHNGYKIIRIGNRYTVYLEALLYYKKHLECWADQIIEEINTIPFMTQLYVKEKRVLLVYQLCREIWFYETFFPLNLFGYLIEPVYLWLLRNNKVLTESQSTKDDLQKYGFKKENISIFPICTDIKSLKSMSEKITYKRPTVLSLGAIRSMKNTLDQIKAFELAKNEIPELQMKVAGKLIGEYGKKVIDYIENSKYKYDIEYLGSVTREQKIDLMRKANLLLVTSVKEGWGLIVTEAATQGTPAIVYDVDGLRDNVKNKEFIVNPDPRSLSVGIINYFNNLSKYKDYQKKLLKDTSNYSIKCSYDEFFNNLHAIS